MTKKAKSVKRADRPSYLAQLRALAIGEEAHFRIVGSAYTNFYNAKWRMERSTDARYKLRKVDDKTLQVIRTN